MLIIRDTKTNIYFHKNKKVMLFTDMNQAQECINMFINYSIQRAMAEGICSPFEIMQAPNNFSIEELPQKYEFETVTWNEIRP